MAFRFLVASAVAVAAFGGPVVASGAAAASAADLYVANDGSDGNPCTTKAEPCHTIGQAIALAAASGTTIHVAKGQYDTVSPGSKSVTVVGVGSDLHTGTVIAEPGAAVYLDHPATVLTLKSLAVEGDPVGAYVKAGTLKTSHVTIAQTSCAVYMTDGTVTLTDSTIDQSGAFGSTNCIGLPDDPAAIAVTVNGGELTMLRSSLTNTKDEPGIVVNSGTFTATGSVFSNVAYGADNHTATVHIAGGAATIKRSLFRKNDWGLQLTGGSTTVTDSTFNLANTGVSSVGGGSQPTILRSSLIDAGLVGPAVLAGDVLTNQFTAACTEEPTDMGYNYGTRGGCAFSAPTSHNGVATLNLDADAADHGGPTRTVAESVPSALIDTIPPGATWGPEHKALCPAGATDQRGVPRPQGAGCDVGAFEAAATRTAVTGSPDPAAPGQAVTLRAKIIPTGPADDPTPVTGQVTFKTGATKLCSGRPVNSAGVATCETSALPAGSRTVTAAFASSSPYLDSRGHTDLIVGTIPKFGAVDHATATIGKHIAITIHASGTPRPTITKLSGALPKGLTFSGGRGSATIAGTPAHGTAKKYVLHLRAHNVRGNDTEAFTLKVVA